MQRDNGKDRKIIKKLNQTDDEIITIQVTTMAILGVNKNERITPQKLLIYLTIKSPKKYAIKESFIKSAIGTTRPCLLERMAFDLAQIIAKEYPLISYLTLTIKKPEALKKADNAHVTLVLNHTGLN